MLTALKKFKEGLYRKINGWLYTDKRVEYFLEVKWEQIHTLHWKRTEQY